MRNAMMWARRRLEAAWSWCVLLFNPAMRARVARLREQVRAQVERARARAEESARRRLFATRSWCANHMGDGFRVPPKKAAAGYFWKQDQGAADRPSGFVGKWRLYRVVRGGVQWT